MLVNSPVSHTPVFHLVVVMELRNRFLWWLFEGPGPPGEQQIYQGGLELPPRASLPPVVGIWAGWPLTARTQATRTTSLEFATVIQPYSLPSPLLTFCLVPSYFFFKKYHFYVCVYVFCTMCVQCLQKLRVVSDFLELELQMSMRHHVDARSLTRVFWKSSLCF